MKSTVAVPLINLSMTMWVLMSASVYGQDNSLSYYDFPPLYKFDDYDSCLAQHHDDIPTAYCMVYAEVKQKNASKLWQQMVHHYKEYPFRYRYDRLFFGVCVKRCKDHRKTTSGKQKLTEDDFLKNEVTDYFGKVHKRSLDKKFRNDYHNLLHTCLDEEFQQKYDLNLKTFIEYCDGIKNNIEAPNKDALESLLYKIIGVIVILNILSTLYDFCLNLQQPEENQNNDFYKVNPQQIVPRLLTSFSVCRNYYRLIQPYYSDVAKDFRFLDGYRSICMIMALYGHVFFSEYQHIANPQYYEKNAKDENNLWVVNTTVIIETYFVMSGLFLFIKMKQSRLITPQTSWKHFIITYMKLMLFRYTRFFPSVGLLLLFNATILTRLQNGPFWRHITEPLRTFSRENGWKNLLMVNNFFNKETASHHTWYIAAEWQLFALYLLVIMIVSKYPRFKKFIYSTLAILSFILPFSITYLLKLQPCFIIKPESYRLSYIENTEYDKIYTPFYTNLFGYLFGIICAEIYFKYTSKENVRKLIREQTKYIIAVHFLVIWAFVIFWLGIKLDVKGPSLWSALYAGLHRNIWIMTVCGIPLLMMSCNCGWIAYEFCCLPMFRLLARLSFQVYIWHLTIVHLLNGYPRQPYYVNGFYYFTQFTSLICISNALAFIIALFFEYPIAQSIQVLQSRKSDKNGKKS